MDNLDNNYKEHKCVSCGIILRIHVDSDLEEVMKKNCWYIINRDRDLYCCPNCDVSVLENKS